VGGEGRLGIRPLWMTDEVFTTDRAEERLPHVRADGLRIDVRVVVGSARLAPIDSRRRGVGDLVAAPRVELASGVGQTHGDAAEIDRRVLHGDLDVLAGAGRLALPEGGHHAEGGVDAGARVSDGWTRLERGRARKSRQRHGATGRLRDHVEALVLAVRAV